MGAFSYEDGYRNKMLGCLLFPKYNSGLQLKIKKTKYRVSGMEWQGDWSHIFCRGLLSSMSGVVLEHLRMNLEEATHSNAV